MSEIPNDELISAYLDGELSGEELARAERLLAEQPEYRQMLDELTALRARLQALPRPSLGPDFASSVLRRADREKESARDEARDESSQEYVPTPFERQPLLSFQRWRRPAIYAAFAVAAALLVMVASPQNRRNAKVAVAPPAADVAAGPGPELRAANPQEPRRDESSTALSIDAADKQPAAAHFGYRSDELRRQDGAALSDELALQPAADEVLVVRCDVPAGIDGEAKLRQLLAEHKIAWEEEPPGALNAKAASEAQAQQSQQRAKDSRYVAQPKSASLNTQLSTIDVSPDAIYVEAQPAQLQATLAALGSSDAFRAVTVAATPPGTKARGANAANEALQSADRKLKDAPVVGDQTRRLGGATTSPEKPSDDEKQKGEAGQDTREQDSASAVAGDNQTSQYFDRFAGGKSPVAGRAMRLPLAVVAERLGIEESIRRESREELDEPAGSARSNTEGVERGPGEAGGRAQGDLSQNQPTADSTRDKRIAVPADNAQRRPRAAPSPAAAVERSAPVEAAGTISAPVPAAPASGTDGLRESEATQTPLSTLGEEAKPPLRRVVFIFRVVPATAPADKP